MQQREPFGGKIWLLADEGTASGAEAVTAMLKLNNLATIVGQPTRGMFGTTSDVGGTALSLPNTGIRFRIDTTLHKDRDGNILQGYGIQPHYYPREGMDALETVLVMIAEGLQ
jgi:C-terminal processing protease CtpA/Prc